MSRFPFFWSQTMADLTLYMPIEDVMGTDLTNLSNGVIVLSDKYPAAHRTHQYYMPVKIRVMVLPPSNTEPLYQVVFRKVARGWWERPFTVATLERHPFAWRDRDELSDGDEEEDDPHAAGAKVVDTNGGGDDADDDEDADSNDDDAGWEDDDEDWDGSPDQEEDEDAMPEEPEAAPEPELTEAEKLALKNRPPTLTRLNIESLHHVLTFLPVPGVGRCSRVCSAMQRVCAAHVLWKQLCERDIPRSTEHLQTYIAKMRQRAPAFHDPSSNMVRIEQVVQRDILNADILDWKQRVLSPSPVMGVVKWQNAYRTLPFLVPVAVADQRNNRVKIMRLNGSLLHVFEDIANPSGIILLKDGRIAMTQFMASRVHVVSCPQAPQPTLSFQTGVYPRGLAQLADGNLVVCEFGMPRVTIFSLTGQVVRHLQQVFHGPSGVVVLDEAGTIAVTECSGGRVHIYDSTKNQTVRVLHRFYASDREAERAASGPAPDDDDEDDHYTAEMALGEPRGIVLLPGGLLALCDGEMDRITIFTATGRLVRHIRCNLRCPCGIAVLPDGEMIIVSDTDHHRLCIIRWRTGQVVQSFGTSSAGNGEGSFFYPRCIAVLNCL